MVPVEAGEPMAAVAAAGGNGVYSSEDEARVNERLRSLGYVE